MPRALAICKCDDTGMANACFHFHSVLNDFLPAEQVGILVPYVFAGRPAIKDAIEASGIPHTEVAVITVNGSAVGFDYGLQDLDNVDIYPHVSHPDVDAALLQSFLPDGKPAFVLDVHLGKLARFMRTAGFDTVYTTTDPGDALIAEIADTQNRIVLTRDTGLLKRSRIRYGYWLRETQSRAQFREVVGHYRLKKYFIPFSRCSHCNGQVNIVEKEQVSTQLPVGVADDPLLTQFVQCEDCGHVYWQGSHYTHMQRLFDSVC